MRKHIIASLTAAGIIAAAILAVSPSVQVTHGALIVDTPYSSFIADSHGVALAAAPLACGIDTTVWCDVASSMGANR